MGYVGIDTEGARDLGRMLATTADRAEQVRREVVAALTQADLPSQAPLSLGQVHDGLELLSSGVLRKAELAEQFIVDPTGTSATLGADIAEVRTMLTGLIGFAGPADLRARFTGLAPPGADPELDAALARLGPVLLPALAAGQRPELTAQQLADLRVLALRLGIEHAGPPAQPEPEDDNGGGGFLGMFKRRDSGPRNNTEVFWNDFWADGRTPAEVLTDPARLMAWVAGTFELDNRLAHAAGLPGLGDILASHDFATRNSDSEDLAAMISAAEADFAAIATWLPAHLAGRDRTAPTAEQLAQTLAFAARLGWPDPGAAAGDQARLADALAYMKANRVLASALLPTGFSGVPDAPVFLDATGIEFILQLGRDSGVVDQAFLTAAGVQVDRVFAALGVSLTGTGPVELTEDIQRQLAVLVASQLPASVAQSPATQARFMASLSYLRQAANGADLRQRIVFVLAAFRTLTVAGPPALTEKQLTQIVGARVVDVLGRGRLRLRSEGALRKNPEFLLLARHWGIPGKQSEKIGKYKYSFAFDELGVLTSIRRKKRSWLSRAWDTVKSIGKAIWESFEDNPFKAIFQVGKIALGVASFFVPGLQGLGAAAMAMNLAGAAAHALEGDWLSAIGAGLAAFTTGIDITGGGLVTALDAAQGAFVESILDPGTLSFLQGARRIFDIGSSIFRATQAESLVGAIGGGLAAVATTALNGGALLRGMEGVDASFVRDLVSFGRTAGDLTGLVAPTAGLIQALDGGNSLLAFSNGLAALSAGARALGNQAGMFTQREGATTFGFDAQTAASLRTIAAGTGVVANVTRAIDAADRGQAFQAGSFLAAAVQQLHSPQTTVIGDQARIAQRIADVGDVIATVFQRGSAVGAGPVVLDRLTKLVDALTTVKIPPVPTRNPLRTAGAAGFAPSVTTTPAGGSTFDLLLPRPDSLPSAGSLGGVGSVDPFQQFAPPAVPNVPGQQSTQDSDATVEVVEEFSAQTLSSSGFQTVTPPADPPPGGSVFDTLTVPNPGPLNAYDAEGLNAPGIRVDGPPHTPPPDVRGWPDTTPNQAAWLETLTGGLIDQKGWLILDRYMNPAGDWRIIDDPSWNAYMMANNRLADDLDPRVEELAREAVLLARFSGIPESTHRAQFHEEIENGYSTGYEMLHGTNKHLGDFQVAGVKTARELPDGYYEVIVRNDYTWNDVIDPNISYDDDFWLNLGVETLSLGAAAPYDMHITWPAETRLILDPAGNVVESSGYPSLTPTLRPVEAEPEAALDFLPHEEPTGELAGGVLGTSGLATPVGEFPSLDPTTPVNVHTDGSATVHDGLSVYYGDSGDFLTEELLAPGYLSYPVGVSALSDVPQLPDSYSWSGNDMSFLGTPVDDVWDSYGFDESYETPDFVGHAAESWAVSDNNSGFSFDNAETFSYDDAYSVADFL